MLRIDPSHKITSRNVLFTKSIEKKNFFRRSGRHDFHTFKLNIFSTRYENIILFMIGGLTYEESAFANAYNQKRAQNPGLPRILLMSNYVHNTRRFLNAFFEYVLLTMYFSASSISFLISPELQHQVLLVNPLNL